MICYVQIFFMDELFPNPLSSGLDVQIHVLKTISTPRVYHFHEDPGHVYFVLDKGRYLGQIIPLLAGLKIFKS